MSSHSESDSADLNGSDESECEDDDVTVESDDDAETSSTSETSKNSTSEGLEGDRDDAMEQGTDQSDNDEDDDIAEKSDDDEHDEDAAAALLIQKQRLKEAAEDRDKKMRKSGVLYLSTIPPGMNVAKLRETLSQYGQIGRVYLEPDTKATEKKKPRKNTEAVKHGRRYLEGWVEFASKNLAKRVAAALNNRQVGGKRRSPYYESLWNIKYLNRFKWNHLTERLAHEKMIRKHRLRQEMAQAKRQTNFYIENVEKSKMLDKLQSKKAKEGKEFVPLRKFEVFQKLTDDEIRSQKEPNGKKGTKRLEPQLTGHGGSGIPKSVLAKLFPGK